MVLVGCFESDAQPQPQPHLRRRPVPRAGQISQIHSLLFRDPKGTVPEVLPKTMPRLRNGRS